MCKDSGYIKSYRSMLSWRWHDDAGTLSLWMHLLWMANYEDVEWHDMTIKRGQLVTSVKSLSEVTGLSAQQLHTRLERLVKTKEIEVRPTNKFSIITICNYERYQGEQQTTNKQPINNQETNKKQPITIKEYKEEKEIKNNIYSDLENFSKSENVDAEIEEVEILENLGSNDIGNTITLTNDEKRFKKPTIEQIQQYIIEKGYVGIDAEHFFSYYESQGWKVGKNPMKNWKMALNTWNRQNQSRYGNNRSSYQVKRNISEINDAVRSRVAELISIDT